MEEKKGKIKTFWADFKKFISKGNVLDLAVAVVIGAAFNKIVSSLVNDVVMPLISLCVGGANVSDWKWVIKEAVYNPDGVLVTAETALNYGVFIQAIIDFLIIAFTLFVVIKVVGMSSRRLAKMQQGIKKLTRKERKQAKKGEATVESVETTEVEQAQAVPVVEEPKETQEDVLKEIRDILKLQNQSKIDTEDKK